MNEQFREIGRRATEGGAEAYFVGGCVRDLLRGAAIKDVDLALAGDPYEAARRLARDPGSHLFWLRREDGVVRVLLPPVGAEAPLQVDLSPLRGSVDEDLRARDLTINAMGIPAAQGLEPGVQVLDPTGGRADLAAGIVRFPSPAAPENDPLRTLRALRFRWKLGFRLEEAMAQRIRECVPLLSRVSVERVRDELFQLLAMPGAADALAECLSYGMGRWLTGADAALFDEDRSRAASAAVAAVQHVLPEAPADLAALLETQPTPPRRRREVLLWAAAVRALGPELAPAEAARYLALSNDERQIIAKAIESAGPARELAVRWPAPGRLLRRLLERAAAPAAPEAVLLAGAADGWSPVYGELLREALQRHFWPAAPLLTGLEVMQIAGIGPGPRVGQFIEQVEDAHADGLLRAPTEAAEWLRERLRKASWGLEQPEDGPDHRGGEPDVR